MFNLKEFVVKNIVNGIKNGTFSKEYGNIMAVNYLVKGILTEDDVASIDVQITVWEQAVKEEVVEEVPTEDEEPVEDETLPEVKETEYVESETETTKNDTESDGNETVE